VPGHVQLATKPALATAMICRALDAGTPTGWVAGDEVYGANPQLRTALEARRVGYVLAVACHHPVAAGGRRRRADRLAARVSRRAWQQISAGSGAKGHRYYDWAFIRLDDDGAAAAIRRTRRRWPAWCGWPGNAGRSRRPSKPARAWPACTSISCGRLGPSLG
jgi:SRSO17 transposase